MWVWYQEVFCCQAIRINFGIEKPRLIEAMDRIQSAINDRLADG